jgi:ribosomal protein S18 acetylase RimI-like enzyme
MRLRRATTRDYEAVGEVTLSAYEAFTLGPDDPYVEHLRNAAARDLEAELWVATDDGDDKVLGTVTICREGSPWRELGGPDEGEFRMLAVSPAAQGRGVGEALVRMVLDRFREEGALGIVISTLPQMAAAHRLYERLGFERAPERDWSPAPHVALIAYRLDLVA